MELLPQLLFEGPEGLRVELSPEGDAVLTLGAHQAAHLVPERSVALAFALLDAYAPDLLDAVEREVHAQRLRLVQGGADPGGDAA